MYCFIFLKNSPSTSLWRYSISTVYLPQKQLHFQHALYTVGSHKLKAILEIAGLLEDFQTISQTEVKPEIGRQVIQHSWLVSVNVWVSAAKNSQKQNSKAVNTPTMKHIRTMSREDYIYF